MKKLPFLASAALVVAISTPCLGQSLVFGEFTPRSWTQHGVAVTFELLDLAIQGQGFFVLRGENQETYITRDGNFTFDADRYVVYGNTNLRLQNAYGHDLQIPDQVEGEHHGDLKSIRIPLNGVVELVFSDGTSHKLTNSRIGLGLLRPQTKLKHQGGHLFAVVDVNALTLAAAQEGGRGVVYSSSREVLDDWANWLFAGIDEKPSTLDDQGYYVEGTLQLKTKTQGLISSTRRRTISPGDAWWQMESDDRVMWKARVSIDSENIASLDSLIVSTDWNHCMPFSPSIKIKVGDSATLSSEGECPYTMTLRVGKIQSL
jgi:hypothetical protein